MLVFKAFIGHPTNFEYETNMIAMIEITPKFLNDKK